MKESHEKETKRSKFITARFSHLFPVILFSRSLVIVLFALFAPIRSSFGNLRYTRYAFGYYLISSLFFVVFFIVDYIFYRKFPPKSWRKFEWCGTIISLLLTLFVYYATDMPQASSAGVDSKEYVVWSMCLEESGLKANTILDTCSILEPQSWETTSYWKDNTRAVMFLFFADCRTEQLAQNYRLQFLADHKESDLQQCTRNGIITVTSKETESSSNLAISELLLCNNTVIMLTIEGSEYEVNELFDVFSPQLQRLFANTAITEKGRWMIAERN